EMSEDVSPQEEVATEASAPESSALKLNGSFAFKKGMVQIFDESGTAVPVTVLEWKPVLVTQIKTKEKEGYNALQLAAAPRKDVNSSAAAKGHFKKAGAKTDFQFVAEVRQDIPEGAKVGQEVAIETFAPGDTV